MTTLKVSEADFQRAVEDLLTVLGYLHFAVRNSHQRVSARGFPDIVACHPVTGALVFLELKSETGKMSVEQADWLDALNIRSGRWAWLIRPSDMNWLKSQLADGAGKTVT